MGRIYSGATSVIVWLGHASETQVELIKELVAVVGNDTDEAHLCGDNLMRRLEPMMEAIAPLIAYR